jgi:hypothetical protein
MGEIRYGWREGVGKGKEYPVAADQYFHRRGGHFVFDDDAGNMTLATSNSATAGLVGWLQCPKDTAGYNSWKSSSTAKGDSCFVITGLENKFEIPCNATTAVASYVGKGAQIVTTGTTYDMIQQAVYNATPANCNLIIHDVDKTNKTALVSIKPSTYMMI